MLKLNRAKVVIVCLVVAVLVLSSFIGLYHIGTEVSAQSNFLNVKVVGSPELGVNSTKTFSVLVNNSYSGKLSYDWSIFPNDNKIVLLLLDDGSQCNLTFVEATNNIYRLSCSVININVGNQGVGWIDVHDPYTSPTLYLGVYGALYSYLIQTDGLGWYRAVRGSNGQISYVSTSFGDVSTSAIANAVNGTILLGKGTFVGDIVLNRDMRLIGESRRSTILQGTISFNQTSGYVPHDLYPTYIGHMWIDAKGASKDYGVDYQGAVQGVTVEDCRVNGVVADFNMNGADMYRCKWINVATSYGGTYGFYLRNSGYLDTCEFNDIVLGPNNYTFFTESESLVATSNFKNVQTNKPVKQAMVINGYFVRNTFDSCPFGDLDTVTVQPSINFNLLGTSRPNLSNGGNVFDKCGLYMGDVSGGTLNINNSYVGTIFRDCTLSGKVTIGTGAYNTQFINPQPYFTSYTLGQMAVLIDHGVNSKFEGHFSFNEATLVQFASRNMIIPTTSWDVSVANSGLTNQYPNMLRAQTGVTASSNALLSCLMYGMNVPLGNFDTMNFNERFEITFKLGLYTFDTQTTGRFQITQNNAVANLAAVGVGIYVVAPVSSSVFNLYGESYGSTRNTVFIATLNPMEDNLIKIVIDPYAHEVAFYVNGVWKASITTASAIPTNTSGATYLLASIANGGSGGTNGNLYVSNIKAQWGY